MKRIVILIDHPFQVINAIGLTKALSPKYKIDLLISRHYYWGSFDSSRLKQYFNSVVNLPRPTYSWIIPREIFKLFRIRKILKLQYHKNEKFTFIYLSNKIWAESIILSLFPNKTHIAFYSIVAKKLKQEKLIKETNLSKFWGLIFKILQLQKIRFGQNTVSKKFTIDYEKPERSIFDQVFYYISYKSELKLKKDEVYDICPLLEQSKDINNKSKVIFFGDALNNKKHSIYHLQFTNLCLRLLERWHKNSELLYKPHPHDQLEEQSINLGKFKVVRKNLPSELFLLENRNQISACYTISSLALKYALLMSIPSYYFLPLYKMKNLGMRHVLFTQTEYLNKSSFITNFRVKPRLYKYEFSKKKIIDSLTKLKI